MFHLKQRNKEILLSPLLVKMISYAGITSNVHLTLLSPAEVSTRMKALMMLHNVNMFLK